jgi:hypothetical protein
MKIKIFGSHLRDVPSLPDLVVFEPVCIYRRPPRICSMCPAGYWPHLYFANDVGSAAYHQLLGLRPSTNKSAPIKF